ncbi:MAG: (Fe-S)-binding protein [SAR324 cluster bacterium]|nr:(Fe-S)-binding protein [SAR324 cluster bacterium]
MKVGLFIPCYVDQFYPKIAIATLKLLERLKVEVEYPLTQTCCGQPMSNTGCTGDSKAAAKNYVKNFEQFDYIVCPSGSCVSFIRNHYDFLEQTAGFRKVRKNTYELCEFLSDVLKVDQFSAKFPYKVGLHQSCHGHRGLRLAKSSETVQPHFSKIEPLLSHVEGLQLVELKQKDECCGFGGTFSVTEEAVSCKMGIDRINDHIDSGAEVITGVDMSCLMHMEGLIQREKKNLKIVHIAEILAGVTL